MRSRPSPKPDGASWLSEIQAVFHLWLYLSSYYLMFQNGCWSVSHHILTTGSRMKEEGKGNRIPPLAELALFKVPSQKSYIALQLTSHWLDLGTQPHQLQLRLEVESFG